MFELHTSDFDPCPARAILRREGKIDGVAGIALFRGLLAHRALELLHHEPDELLSPIMTSAASHVIDQLEHDGRMPSDAVMNKLAAIETEVTNVLDAYKRRIIPITNNWTLLGTEVPIYWELSSDVHLSSHIDALFITKEGKPIVWDWKWRKDALAISDLSRNLQLACYFATMVDGMVQLDENALSHLEQNHTWEPPDGLSSDCWIYAPDGSPTPEVAWVDLPSLKPYTRKTVAQDDTGKEVAYIKGDDRPLSRAIRTIKHHPDQVEIIKKHALQRASIIQNNVPMYIPQGCSHCECEAFCPRFDIPRDV